LPVKGAVEDGVTGLAKEIGKGLIGMPVKFWAGTQPELDSNHILYIDMILPGMSGIVGYPLQGVDEQIKKAFIHDDLQDVRSSLESLGRIEYADLSDKEKAHIRTGWDKSGYSLLRH
jgi:hypothetical protein